MRCRTADRFPGAPAGVEILAPLVGDALGVEPRYIGSSPEVRETRFEDDLRESRGAIGRGLLRGVHLHPRDRPGGGGRPGDRRTG